MDYQSPHADLWWPVRLLQRVGACGDGAGRTFRSGTPVGSQTVHSLLERLGDSIGRIVRSVRQRQDGAEDLSRQIPGAAGPGIDVLAQSDVESNGRALMEGSGRQRIGSGRQWQSAVRR